MLGLQRARGDRDVAEQAESHAAIGQRVVAGWASERERARRIAAGHERRGRERAAGRRERRIPGGRRHDGVGIEAHQRVPRPGLLGQLPDARDVAVRVNAREVVAPSGGGLMLGERIDQRGRVALDRGDDRGQPALMLRVAPAGIVARAVGVEHERRPSAQSDRSRPERSVQPTAVPSGRAAASSVRAKRSCRLRTCRRCMRRATAAPNAASAADMVVQYGVLRTIAARRIA